MEATAERSPATQASGRPGAARVTCAALPRTRRRAVGASAEAEDSQLLRRQIARRCIFGVDLNPMAVELARLSLWIHTFVPGLPLSFLDHALVRGNSLVGVATIDEAVEALGGGLLFGQGVKELLRAGEVLLERLAGLGFTTVGPLPRGPLPLGRWVFECYPHPAQIVLFGIERSLKYKIKRQGLEAARAEFARYLGYMRALRAPALTLDAALLAGLDVVSNARGNGYKDREDRLDALFCAYLAALLPEDRLELLGEPEAGSIVVPSRVAAPRTPVTSAAARTQLRLPRGH